MNAAVNDPRTSLACDAAHFVPAQCDAGVDTNANDIAGLNGLGNELLKHFVHDDRVAERSRGSGREDIKPAWRDDTVPKVLSLRLIKCTLIGTDFLVRD